MKKFVVNAILYNLLVPSLKFLIFSLGYYYCVYFLKTSTTLVEKKLSYGSVLYPRLQETIKNGPGQFRKAVCVSIQRLRVTHISTAKGFSQVPKNGQQNVPYLFCEISRSFTLTCTYNHNPSSLHAPNVTIPLACVTFL